ncbi:DUF6966 domain-containing protein [Candidatus Laterigemmans baculatus]|uniref:DUF6966 domain-containing protein n=1 Tax=Candidatus Laterigemmans baculatus TaxID=2770505 RepID=UPI0036F2568A
MPNRSEQLRSLVELLRQLTSILREIHGCRWTAHFQSCLATAEYLDAVGFAQSDLNELASRVGSVYGGSGSFNDYVPFHEGQELMNKVDALRTKVADNATELRVISRH